MYNNDNALPCTLPKCPRPKTATGLNCDIFRGFFFLNIKNTSKLKFTVYTINWPNNPICFTHAHVEAKWYKLNVLNISGRFTLHWCLDAPAWLYAGSFGASKCAYPLRSSSSWLKGLNAHTRHNMSKLFSNSHNNTANSSSYITARSECLPQVQAPAPS